MYSLVTMISLGILTKRSIAGFLEETGPCRYLRPDWPGEQSESLLTNRSTFA
jgi:hypothetical protein